MLLVYNVDIGKTYAFDMAFVTKSVRELKAELSSKYGIEYKQQVLFVSGGVIMDSKSKVSKYQAGTEDNPIFLVDMKRVEPQASPMAYIPPTPDEKGLYDCVETAKRMASTLDTVIVRAELAKRFHEHASAVVRVCEQIQRDHRLQYQGFLALKCHLEDMSSALSRNLQVFKKVYAEFLEQKPEVLKMLQNFETTRELIGKIPLPECLASHISCERLLRESAISTRPGGGGGSTAASALHQFSAPSSGPPSSGAYYVPVTEPSSSTESSAIIDELPLHEEAPVESSHRPGGGGNQPAGLSLEGGAPRPTLTATGRLVSDASMLGHSPDTGAPLSIAIPSGVYAQERLQRALQEDSYITSNRTMQQLILSPSEPKSPPDAEPLATGVQELEQHQALTLNDWIRGRQANDPLELVKKEIEAKFTKLTEELGSQISARCVDGLGKVHNPSMSEFKGLDVRLVKLEEILTEMRSHSARQETLAQSFVANKERLWAEKDSSVLPTICASHAQQLGLLADTQRRISDIHAKVRNAKQEMTHNVQARLRWLLFMMQHVRDANSEIVLTQEMIRKLGGYIRTLRQLHSTPQLFARCLVEGFRRRRFAQRYRAWATDWAAGNNKVYTSELSRRRQFNDSLSGHFLMCLFPGYGDQPPTFATQPPKAFDTRLPDIQESDIKSVKERVPEIAEYLTLPSDQELGYPSSSQHGAAQTSPSLYTTHTTTSIASLPAVATSTRAGRAAPGTSAAGSEVTSPSDSDDIVVLNAAGVVGGGSKQISPADITQSVEVIHGQEAPPANESGSAVTVTEPASHVTLVGRAASGAVNIPGTSQRAGESLSLMLSESPQPPRSLSLHNEDFCYGDDSLSPPFQSFKPPSSLPDTHRGLKSPDLDEYATADFYIGESMPSTMSTSTPERTIAELQVQLHQSREQVTKLTAELEQLKTVRLQADAQLITLRTSLRELDAPGCLGRLGGELKALREGVLDEKQTVAEDFSTLSTGVRDLANRYQEDRSSLVADLEKLRLESQELREASERARTATLEDLNTQRTELCANISQLETEKTDLVAKLAELESSNELLKTQLNNLETEKPEAAEKQKALETEIASLKANVEMLEAEKSKLCNVVTTMESTISEYQSTISQLEQEKSEQLKLIESLQSQADELQAKLKQTLVDLDTKTRLLETAEAEKASAEERLVSEQESAKQAGERCRELEGELASAREQLETAAQERDASSEEAATAAAQHTQEVERLREQHACAHTELTEKLNLLTTTSATQLQELNTTLVTLREERDAAQSRVGELKETLSQNEQRYRAAIEQCEATTKSSLLEHEVELERVRSDLRQELDSKEEEVRAAEQRLAAAQEEVTQLHAKCDQLQSELDKIKEELQAKFEAEKAQLSTIFEKEKEKLNKDFEKEKEQLELRFQELKDEVVRTLAREKEVVLSGREAALREQLSGEHELQLQERLKQLEEQLRGEHQQLVEKLEQEHKSRIEELDCAYAQTVETLRAQHQEHLEVQALKIEEEAARALRAREEQLSVARQQEAASLRAEREREEEMRESVAFQYHKKLTELRSDLERREREVQILEEDLQRERDNLKQLKESGELLTRERHAQLVEKLKEEWDERRLDAINQALEAVQKQHTAEKSALESSVELQREEMERSVTAERQVLFNTALNQAVASKDHQISELQQELASLQEKVNALQGYLDLARSERDQLKTELDLSSSESGECIKRLQADLTKAKEAEKQAVTLLRGCQQELSRLKAKADASISGLGLGAMSRSLMSPTAASPPAPLQGALSTVAVATQTSPETAEQEKGAVGGSSLESGSSIGQDKVSIHTFSKGDVVLLFYDEKHGHYVVFSLSPLLHFLHADSYAALGLNPVAGEERKSWVLAEIVEKEHCQARKAQNRFKIPQGTKFFRVRCRPYQLPRPSSTHSPTHARSVAMTTSTMATAGSSGATAATEAMTRSVPDTDIFMSGTDMETSVRILKPEWTVPN